MSVTFHDIAAKINEMDQVEGASILPLNSYITNMQVMNRKEVVRVTMDIPVEHLCPSQDLREISGVFCLMSLKGIDEDGE